MLIHTHQNTAFIANDNAIYDDCGNNETDERSLMDFLRAQDMFAPEEAIEILRECLDRGVNILS